ncbi:MAG: hypothetical protein AAF555_03605 [Verrucomicrobiota bacterium]
MGKWGLFLLGLVGVPWSVAAQDSLAVDIVHYREEGQPPLRCRLVRLLEDRVEVRILNASGRGYSSQTRAIPRSEIDFIDFYESEELQNLLKTADREDLETLKRIWTDRHRLLMESISDQGTVGLVYARLLLLHHETEFQLEEALDVFQAIETLDWKESRRLEARRGRFEVMLAQGQDEAVLAEARQIYEESPGGNPELLVMAQQVLADLAFSQLRELVEENPRWDLDDRVRPQRQELYHRTLDLYLQGYLLHGDFREGASAGLLGALRVYQHAGERELARQCAEDLLQFYPDSLAAVEAGSFLEAFPTDTP